MVNRLTLKITKKITFILLAVFVGCSLKKTFNKPVKKWNKHTIDNSLLGADGVRTEDVNADGLPDLVTGWEQSGVSGIYIMNRKKNNTPTWDAIYAGKAPDVEDALLIDLDKDGAMDIISSTEGETKKILIHWAPSKKTEYNNKALWKTETLFQNDSRWMYAIPMNVDDKNGLDIIIGGKGKKNGSIGWLECPPNPRKINNWKFHKISDVRWTMSIISHDIDNDGVKDIVVSDRKGKKEGVFWLKKPEAKALNTNNTWSKTWIADDLYETNFIDIDDLDNDGKNEIIVAHKTLNNAGAITVLSQNNNNEWNRNSIKLPVNVVKPKAVNIADIDLDGRKDIVLSTESAYDNSGIIWLKQPENWKKNNWIPNDISGVEGVKFDLNLLLDLDNDGDIDVINTEENNNSSNGIAGLGLIWYENPIK